MSQLHLRDATPDDVAAITAIYRPYVLYSTATMEIDPPGEEEMRRRLNDVHSRDLPFLIAELEGEVMGYGYVSPFRARAGYRYSLEDSVYLDERFLGRGYGRQILAALIDASREYGARQMVAVIGGNNQASAAMHERMGFRHAGVLQGVGWKFEQPQDVALMQLKL